MYNENIMKSKLLGLLKSKTFWAWFVVILIILISVFYKQLFEKPQVFSAPLKVTDGSDYKITKISPLEIISPKNPNIFGNKIVYTNTDNLIAIYDINTQKTKLTKYTGSNIDVNEKYVVFPYNKEPNSEESFISLYNLSNDTVLEIGRTQSSNPIVKISNNYAYWEGDDGKSIRYDINSKNLKDFELQNFWKDAFDTKVIYQKIEGNKPYITLGDLNNLVIYDTETDQSINLPENGDMKSFLNLSESYVAWVSNQLGPDSKINLYSINTGNTEVLDIPQRDGITALDVSKNTVVYVSPVNNEFCLFSYDLESKQEKQIYCNGYISDVKIDNNKIVVGHMPYVTDSNPHPESEILLIEI